MMTDKPAAELAEERRLRVEKAFNLEEPDRVPLFGIMGDVVPAYAGITQYEYCFDYEKARRANAMFLKEFPCDISLAGISGIGALPLSIAVVDYPDLSPSISFVNGPFHDILGDRYSRFPGRELSEDSSPQFIGGTFMEPEEYDELIADPVKFTAEKILPRSCRNLENPGSSQYIAAMVRLGAEIGRMGAAMQAIMGDLLELGIPLLPQTMSYAPLDYIGDFLRDISNIVLDLRRYPEKVKQACEALVDPILKMSLALKPAGARFSMIPLHLNEYLSPDLYQEFYWPTLKKVILGLAKEGLKSIVFFEGYHDAHLETILELPRGWGVAYFEKTDVKKAKEVLKGHTCVMGGIPISLVISGTPADIDEYLKDLLEDVKPGGGFVLAPGVANAPKETPPQNIKAVIEAVEKYGRY